MIATQYRINRATRRADLRRALRLMARRAAHTALLAAHIALALMIVEVGGETLAAIWGP